MRVRVALALGLLTAGILAAGSACAANPRVTLKLEKVDLREALSRLSEVTQVPLQLYEPTDGFGGNRMGPNYPTAAEIHTFDWQGVPLGTALRELCARYRLQPYRDSSGYRFAPADGPPPRERARPIGLFQKSGMRLWPMTVALYQNRTRQLAGEGQDEEFSSLSLQVSAELGAYDPERIAGVTGISARDDTGALLVSEQDGSPGEGEAGGAYPDEYSFTMTLTPPHPKAKRLEWVEGTLLGFRKLESHRLEMAPPEPGKQARTTFRGVIVVLSQYRPEGVSVTANQLTPRPAEDDRGLPVISPEPEQERVTGAGLRVRMFIPNDQVQDGPRNYFSQSPEIRTRSGKQVEVLDADFRGGGSDQYLLYDTQLVFRPVKGEEIRLVWNFVERADPVPLLTFRLKDIPLPEARPFRAVRPVASPAEGPRPEQESPFYQRGGGRIVSPLRVGAGAAPEGTLQLGLAAWTDGDWGPTRWTQLEISPGRTPELGDVKPGRYRVLRVLRPTDGAAQPTRGRWLNNEVVVTLRAGVTETLAPLTWEPEPPIRPTAPAPKKTTRGR